MDGTAMLALFRHETGDDVGPSYLWSDERVLGFLTEGEQQACIRGNLIRETRIITLDPSEASPEVPLGDPRMTKIERIRLQWPDADSTRYTELDLLNVADQASGDRTRTGKPCVAYRHDQLLMLDKVPIEAGVLHIEGYREPWELETVDDEPEIAPHLHLHLVDWALFRAYSRKDSQTYDQQRAEQAKARYEAVFGKEPRADSLRARQEKRRTSTRPRGLMS